MADDEDYYPIYEFAFVTGDYVYRRILVKDPDPNSPDPENPIMIPRDFTGWSARAQIRKDSKRITDLMATFVVTLGYADPTDGFVVMELLPAESEKCLDRAGWDMEFIDPSGRPETVMGGPVSPLLDYTR